MFGHIGSNVLAHHTVRTYGRNHVEDDCILLENVVLGHPSTGLLLELRQVDLNLEHAEFEGVRLGQRAVIRSDSILYCGVTIDHHVRTGHGILVRENTTIGHNVLIGTNTVIDNDCTIGSHVSLQTRVYIPTGTVVEDYVFMGPGATVTNDRMPIRTDEGLLPATIRRGASIGANATILPGVVVGEGAFVAAGAVVTKDVPDWHMAIGAPARFTPLPDELRVENRIK